MCGKLLPNYQEEYVCDACYTGVLRHNICQRCGKPYKVSETACLACKQEIESPITRVVGLFPYDENYRTSILRWKYTGVRKYARGYADLLVHDLDLVSILEGEALIPIPLSPSRLQKRGFNQAYDLAEAISTLTEVPVYDCLRRNRNTKPQAQCSKSERISNIKGSIEINTNCALPDLKKVILVDDIYTTGSTARECIKVLQRQYEMRDATFYLMVVGIGG